MLKGNMLSADLDQEVEQKRNVEVVFQNEERTEWIIDYDVEELRRYSHIMSTTVQWAGLGLDVLTRNTNYEYLSVFVGYDNGSSGMPAEGRSVHARMIVSVHDPNGTLFGVPCK